MVAIEDGRSNPSVSCADSSPCTGAPEWRRCYSAEPEEGQTVELAEPRYRMWCAVATYRDGEFVDRDGDKIDDISSAMFWRALAWPDWSAEP